jgi:bacterioferritin (cytochrome b1)
VVAGSDGFLRDPLSRRSLLGVAGAGTSAVLLAGCGDDTKNPNVKTGPDESDNADVELLNTMLDLELMAVAAYKTGAARLRGSALQSAKGFLEQEQEHADALAQAIRDLSGVPNEPKTSYAFQALRTQADALQFAVQFENNLIAAYIDVLPKLSPGKLRSTVSGILTCEAEHVAVLRGALGEPQVPDAFVVGRAA